MCRWIATLEDQRFAGYPETLRAELTKQGISEGADLPEIDPNDLYTMGIQNFKDRKALAAQFRNLDSSGGTAAAASEGTATVHVWKSIPLLLRGHTSCKQKG